jgi:hypothetical protein
VLWVPQKGGIRVQHNTGSVGIFAPGTAVVTGGAASTKGTPVQLIASTSFETYWVTVVASDYAASSTASQGALDLLIGTSPEEVFVPDLLMGYCGSLTGTVAGPKRWDFPLYIPAGSRLAARAAGARINAIVRVWVFLYGGDGLPPSRVGTRVTTYGMGTVPNGTTVTPGATGTEGAWAQMSAATTEAHFALVPSFQMSGVTSSLTRALAVDLGVGTVPEEQVMESYWFSTDAVSRMTGPQNSWPCFVDVPISTRLAMRASNNGTNNTYNGVIHAVG